MIILLALVTSFDTQAGTVQSCGIYDSGWCLTKFVSPVLDLRTLTSPGTYTRRTIADVAVGPTATALIRDETVPLTYFPKTTMNATLVANDFLIFKLRISIEFIFILS